MFKILKYMKKKDWLLFLYTAVFIILQVWMDLKLPDYMSEITTLVETEGSEMSEILAAGGKMLLCALGSFAACICTVVLSSRMAANFGKTLRELQYDQVEAFSMAEINRFSTASLITRSTNDIAQIQMMVAMGLEIIVKAPVTAIWAITKIAGKGREWSIATAVAVVILLAMMGIIMKFALPRFKKIQGLTDNINRITREHLTGIRVVRAYNAEDYQEEKFGKANDELTDNNLFAFRVMAILNPGIQLVMNGLSLAVYWIGAILLNQAAATDKIGIFSNMVVFVSYAVQVVMSFMSLSMIFMMLPRVTVAANRVREVIETKLSIQDGTMTNSPNNKKGEIVFKNVSFKYPDAEGYVLKDINFTAKKGETVAFIGSTGSGKSTLVNLIPRFYDATEGEVLVDGQNVKDYTQEALHNKFGYVPQSAVMFAGTVSSSIAYGDNGKGAYSKKSIEKAAEIAQAKEFVEKLPDKYDGGVAQGGTNLSGGQKQRLSIARAVCREPEIYIFDDSFSALDYKTDRVLRSALKKETKEATTLIVAQRIGTIMDADKIIVLDQGRMVGEGTHRELLKNCKVYQDIALSQLSKEELA
ncbi:MAG: ABC transporter ATP-binding protein [Eubacteriales bacterium]|nr:ABC transporter ATP-binding protein [Eubacteriales bacterium]